MLDTRVFEVEYLYVNKASLYASTISEIYFSQVDEKGDLIVIFDEIVEQYVYGTQTMQQDHFIVSNNGGKIRMDSTKDW